MIRRLYFYITILTSLWITVPAQIAHHRHHHALIHHENTSDPFGHEHNRIRNDQVERKQLG